MSTPHKKHNPGFVALVDDAKTRIREITAAEWGASADGLLIDLREDHEWVDGHAAGATHLSRGILERDIETIAPEKSAKIVLYCGGGYRSALSAESLAKMGYTNVWSLAGGWRAWQAAGLPIKKD
ncbi:MAG TPA: rhodanese-like domain-containing protein [Bryobacteraceae bacterium]|nr:rhodanese-like domain-containing protein [Bryobacteraceae bacterium]